MAEEKKNHDVKSQSKIPGIRNAKVLPDPVFALPTRSRPSSRVGIVLAWISVIWVKPMSAIPFKVLSQTWPLRLAKLLSDKIPANSALLPGTEKKVQKCIFWLNSSNQIQKHKILQLEASA